MCCEIPIIKALVGNAGNGGTGNNGVPDAFNSIEQTTDIIEFKSNNVKKGSLEIITTHEIDEIIDNLSVI